MNATARIEARAVSLSEVNKDLHRLDRRDWRLWAITIGVMTAMAFTTVVLAFEIRPHRGDILSQLQLDTAVHALLAIVLLFSIFLIHQQIVIRRWRLLLTIEAQRHASL